VGCEVGYASQGAGEKDWKHLAHFDDGCAKKRNPKVLPYTTGFGLFVSFPE